MRSSQTTDWPT